MSSKYYLEWQSKPPFFTSKWVNNIDQYLNFLDNHTGKLWISNADDTPKLEEKMCHDFFFGLKLELLSPPIIHHRPAKLFPWYTITILHIFIHVHISDSLLLHDLLHWLSVRESIKLSTFSKSYLSFMV